MKVEIKPDGFLHVTPETEFEAHNLKWWCSKNTFIPDWPNMVIETERLDKAEEIK